MERVRNLAIIPARSGSKGLKDKNIKPLCGKPLLAHTIEAAIGSGIFEMVYVSTDSQRYADIAAEYGAEVPFLRSEENATDQASSWDVVREVILRFQQIGKSFDMVTLLQPTTPLRNSQDIIKAYELYQCKNANAVVSVCETEHSPLWCNTLPEDLSLTGFIHKEVSALPRQELKTYYRINGGIYMVNVDSFRQTESIYESGCYAYIMNKMHSVDIDDKYDFIVAEAILGLEGRAYETYDKENI